MNARLVSVLFAAALAVCALLQGLRGTQRLAANRALKTVEAVTARVATLGTAGPAVLSKNLRVLEGARGNDPSNGSLALASGAQYLLLRRFPEAQAAYREALRLEPRAEVYLNLGRTFWLAGQTDAARPMLRAAVALYPRFADQLPASAEKQ